MSIVYGAMFRMTFLVILPAWQCELAALSSELTMTHSFSTRRRVQADFEFETGLSEWLLSDK